MPIFTRFSKEIPAEGGNRCILAGTRKEVKKLPDENQRTPRECSRTSAGKFTDGLMVTIKSELNGRVGVNDDSRAAPSRAWLRDIRSRFLSLRSPMILLALLAGRAAAVPG